MCIALSCLITSRDVVGAHTRDQCEELTEMQGWATKMATAKTSNTVRNPYQDSRNQMKRIAIPAAQQKSIRHRRVSSGPRSGHSSQTPGGSNAKFLGQREHAGPSRPLLLHNKQNYLADRITFRMLISSSNVFGTQNTALLIALCYDIKA